MKKAALITDRLAAAEQAGNDLEAILETVHPGSFIAQRVTEHGVLFFIPTRSDSRIMRPPLRSLRAIAWRASITGSRTERGATSGPK